MSHRHTHLWTCIPARQPKYIHHHTPHPYRFSMCFLLIRTVGQVHLSKLVKNTKICRTPVHNKSTLQCLGQGFSIASPPGFFSAFAGALVPNEASYNVSQNQTLMCSARLVQTVCLNVWERSLETWTMIVPCSRSRIVKVMFGVGVMPLNAG